MEIILLESFDRLGKIGDVVNVKDGFARNFLLPKKKALRANKENKEFFEKIKNSLEEKNKKLVINANVLSEELVNKEIIFVRQASESGQLYGSVSPKDISNQLKKDNINVAPASINLPSAIKKIGIFKVKIKLHADVSVSTNIIVAISQDNAEELMKEFKKDKLKTIKTNEKEIDDKLENNLPIDSVKLEEKSSEEKVAIEETPETLSKSNSNDDANEKENLKIQKDNNIIKNKNPKSGE